MKDEGHTMQIVVLENRHIFVRKGEVYPPNTDEERDTWTAGIDVQEGGKRWGNRIECYGATKAEAVGLRDFVFGKIEGLS